MQTSECKTTELGFVEECNPRNLQSCFFPSKIGGKPSWLFLESVPSADQIICQSCDKLCIFLLQIYCPLDNKSLCFHRTLFVFACKTPACYISNSAQCIKVYRSQVPRVNKYYGYEPIDEFCMPEKLPSAIDYQNICELCGCAGRKVCSKCKSVYYCSKEHQVIDWKNSHKYSCNKETPAGDGM